MIIIPISLCEQYLSLQMCSIFCSIIYILVATMIMLPIIASLIILQALFAYAISGQSAQLFGIPLMYLLPAYTAIVQVIAFIPALIFNTQKYYDITGSFTFISTTIMATLINPSPALTQLVAAAMVITWSGRLGYFLFTRILRVGEDIRFRKIKQSTLRFLNVWLMQGMWVFLCMAPLLIHMTQHNIKSTSLGLINYLGIAIWVLGMIIQVAADNQKRVFTSNPLNKDKFISGGIWSYSRHPNYAGEIILWLGTTIYAMPFLRGWSHLSLICPLFVYVLLRYVSGVPMLQAKADKKWGTEEDYIKYKNSTPILFPSILGGKP